jgi:hypothetical protein
VVSLHHIVTIDGAIPVAADMPPMRGSRIAGKTPRLLGKSPAGATFRRR